MEPNIFRLLDIGIREPIDAEALIYDLLNDCYPCEEWPNVWVYSELDVDVNPLLENGCVIIYGISNPVQHDRGMWWFTVSFTVLGADVVRPVHLARHLYKTVLEWPWHEATSSGHVHKIRSIDAPVRRSDAKENAGKTIKEYGFDAAIAARDLIKP